MEIDESASGVGPNNNNRKRRHSPSNNETMSKTMKVGDEVCVVQSDKIIFGTLEHHSGGPKDLWGIKWSCDDEMDKQMPRNELILTDRALYRGSKVKKDDITSLTRIGTCRSTSISIDVRILGTTTILPNVRSENFSHLKEYKQKTIVYKNGWIGIITAVERTAIVRFYGIKCKLPLIKLTSSSVGNATNKCNLTENPWICEQHNVSGADIANATLDNPEDKPKMTELLKIRRAHKVSIEDLEVEKVSVTWKFQVDLDCPDTPTKSIAGSKLKSLQIIREELCDEGTFQVGNLGRYKIQATDENDIIGLDEWNKNFSKKNLQIDNFGGTQGAPTDPVKALNRAYAENPEDKIKAGNSVVVEIHHVTGTADVMWPDQEMEFVKSLDLIVVNESLLENGLVPGDFVHSCRENIFPSIFKKSYGVILWCKGSKVSVKILSCTDPPVTLKTIEIDSSLLVPHPRYKYFNQKKTIVVANMNNKTRVGNVMGSNLEGKVSIEWEDTKKMEWCWPTICSIYTIRSFDLDCIYSQITDSDDDTDEYDQRARFISELEKIIQMKKLWNEESDNILQRHKTAQWIVDSCQQLMSIEEKLGHKDTFFSVNEFSAKKEKLDLEALKDKNFVKEFTNWVSTIEEQSKNLQGIMDDGPNNLWVLPPPKTASGPAINGGGTFHSETVEDDFSKLQVESYESFFLNKVEVDEVAPPNHTYIKQTENIDFKMLLKIVKEELNNLRESCPPGIKVKAYADRMDLFSIMIAGPEKTPYENAIFLFDACLPPNYPNIPPKFQFHSFSAGRLNPNLYEQGKVCVSLLGTWGSSNKDENWTKDSNLVQVLLSIQGLILVKDPYHNEPGFEASKFNQASNKKHNLDYNSKLMPLVAKMMLNQLSLPLTPWEKEIKEFYAANVPKFVRRWTVWQAEKKAKTYDEFIKKLSKEDIPGYEIYPFQHPETMTDLCGKLSSFIATLQPVTADGEASSSAKSSANK